MGPHTEWGQLGEEPLRDGATSFSNCAPETWRPRSCISLPDCLRLKGGACNSVSLATIIQPFPNLSLRLLEHSLSSQGILSPVWAVLSFLPPALSRAGDPGACVCCEG